MDLWTSGATRARGPTLFGSRVPHKMGRKSREIGRTPKGKLTIDGFMECLEWYVSERLPDHMGTERIGKDHVRYHIFVATVPPTEKKSKPNPTSKTTTRNSSTKSTTKRPDPLRDMLKKPRVLVAPQTPSRLVIPPFNKPGNNDPSRSTAETTTDEKVS
jgi:hypothetical protein